MIPLIVARVFAVVSGLFGVGYLIVAVRLLLEPASSPGAVIDARSLAQGLVVISALPAALGFYLLYCYARLSFRMPMYFSPKTIWIVTGIFNLIGAIYFFWIPSWPEWFLVVHWGLRFWSVSAVCLAVLALLKLCKAP